MLIGHSRIWNFLEKSVNSRRLAHAYLFVGAPNIGKKKLALNLATTLQCEKAKSESDDLFYCGQCVNCILIAKGHHPDVLVIEQSGTAKEEIDEKKELLSRNSEIKIEQIRVLQHQISLSPFSAARKIIIIDNADLMNLEAANCLLKTLEEPPQKSLLILISANWHKILPTIISRCQLIRFLPVKRDIISDGLGYLFKDKNRIEQAVRFSCGRPGVAITLMERRNFFDEKKEMTQEFSQLLKKDLPEKFKYAQKLSQDIVVAKEILADWVMWLRDGIFENFGTKDLLIFRDQEAPHYTLSKICGMIKNIQAAQLLIGESGFNSRLILENLMIKL